jgi:hypothetical protein
MGEEVRFELRICQDELVGAGTIQKKTPFIDSSASFDKLRLTSLN